MTAELQVWATASYFKFDIIHVFRCHYFRETGKAQSHGVTWHIYRCPIWRHHLRTVQI